MATRFLASQMSERYSEQMRATSRQHEPELRLRNERSAHLYPLPDGVVRRRPAVLVVVETRSLGRPVGVVLGGGDDLLGGDLPRLHAQWLHTGEHWRAEKINPLKAKN